MSIQPTWNKTLRFCVAVCRMDPGLHPTYMNHVSSIHVIDMHLISTQHIDILVYMYPFVYICIHNIPIHLQTSRLTYS